MRLSPEITKPIDLLTAAELDLPKRRNWLLRGALLLGGLAVAGGIMGASWSAAYVQNELVPQLSQELTRLLERPIQLGAIEQISWSGLRVGRSVIPATATDANELSVEAIDVRFNPVQAFQQRRVLLTVTLVRPTGYFDQTPDGKWVNLDLKFDDDEQIEVEKIRLQDATLTLAPQPVILDADPLDPGEVWDTSAHPRQMTLRHVSGSLSLQDQGERLLLDLVAQPVELGETEGKLQGKIQLKGDARFKAKQFQIALRTQALQLNSLSTFIPTDFKLLSGRLDADLNVKIQPDRPVALSGEAKLRQLSARAKGEPNLFSGVEGDIRLRQQDILLSRGKLNFGLIPFGLDGNINLERGFNLKARVDSVEAQPFMKTLKLNPPFPVEGTLEAPNLHLTGSFEHPTLWGTAHAGKPIKFDRLAMASVVGSFRLDLGTHYLQLEQILAKPVMGGTVETRGELWLEHDDAKLQVEAKLPADAIAQLYALDLPEQTLGQLNAQAQVSVDNNDPTVAADWQLVQGRYPAAGKVSFAQDVLRLHQMQAKIGDGQITAAAELTPRGWQAQLNGAQIPLNQLSPQIPGKLQAGRLQAQLQAAGKDLSLTSLQATGDLQLRLDQGSAQADLTASQGRWQADVTGTAPMQLLANLPGNLAGQLQLRGQLNQLDLAQTEADGAILLTETLPQPVTAEFDWKGEKLHLKQSGTEHVRADGWITPDFSSLSNSVLDLNLNIQDYNLAQLPLSLPVAPAGLVNLDGKVSGTPAAPQIYSSVKIAGLSVQDFRFEPLQGQLQSQPDHRVSLDLKGRSDRLALTLDSHYRPAEFAVQLDRAVVEGRLVGERLLARLQNFDLEKLNLAPVEAMGLVRGRLAGDVDVNLAKPLAATEPFATANLEVTQPGLGAINAQPTPEHMTDRLTGQVTYQNGIASLSQGTLQLGSSSYRLAAEMNPQAEQFKSQVVVDQGKLQDLLSLLPPDQLIALVQPIAESLPASLPVQMPTSAEIAQLNGLFSAALSVQSAGDGLTAQLGLQGQDWQLADYKIGRLAVANAELKGQTLMLPSVRAEEFSLRLNNQQQQFDAQFGFAGQVSPTAVAGQLQLVGLDLPQIKAAFDLPIELTGRVHALAQISGSPSQPDLTGTLHLSGVNLRDLPIDEAKVGFSFINQQLQLESWQGLEAQADAQVHLGLEHPLKPLERSPEEQR